MSARAPGLERYMCMYPSTLRIQLLATTAAPAISRRDLGAFPSDRTRTHFDHTHNMRLHVVVLALLAQAAAAFTVAPLSTPCAASSRATDIRCVWIPLCTLCVVYVVCIL